MSITSTRIPAGVYHFELISGIELFIFSYFLVILENGLLVTLAK
jgi:hypothetical protein